MEDWKGWDCGYVDGGEVGILGYPLGARVGGPGGPTLGLDGRWRGVRGVRGWHVLIVCCFECWGGCCAEKCNTQDEGLSTTCCAVLLLLVVEKALQTRNPRSVYPIRYVQLGKGYISCSGNINSLVLPPHHVANLVSRVVVGRRVFQSIHKTNFEHSDRFCVPCSPLTQGTYTSDINDIFRPTRPFRPPLRNLLHQVYSFCNPPLGFQVIS
jgi:hypothetical protein